MEWGLSNFSLEWGWCRNSILVLFLYPLTHRDIAVPALFPVVYVVALSILYDFSYFSMSRDLKSCQSVKILDCRRGEGLVLFKDSVADMAAVSSSNL